MGTKRIVAVDIDGVVNMTDQAVCVDVGKGRFNGVWVPLSMVEDVKGMSDEEFGEWVNTTKEITVPEWWAIQKGLV